jgi:glycosyltransferase involved in cell wall biosynthesis
LVAKLAQHLAPGGTVLLTTPYGPWEAIGYKQHPGWRAHLHHFERADLYELFGRQADYRLLAVPHTDELGHFILTFRPQNQPIGTIDYRRKLASQAPAETLSLCMIVKNAEHTLGRCLGSVRDIVQEIVVALDRTTTDESRRVAEQFGARVIEIDSPLETGFDAARNASIAAATGDWILWLDDDETLENPERLVKYLRANGLDGYALRQHHVAAEPAALLKTDLPVRLFRNRRGIRFFGVVHEHPEKAVNEGAGRVWLIPDVDILHTGYLTENVRRGRFERNFPLMVRDRQTYPERKLGKFLMVRDIAHLIRYQMERTGGSVGPQVRAHAEVALALWRELLAAGETRLIVEALPFLAQSVALLGGGIDYVVNVAAAPSGKNGGPKLPAEPVRALLPTTEDVMKLTAHLAKEQVRLFDERYF